MLLSCADRSMQVKEMVECTRKAWNLVKGRLYTHGKLILTLRLICFNCAVYVHNTGSYFELAYKSYTMKILLNFNSSSML